MISTADVRLLANELLRAERSANAVELLTDRHPSLTWDDARAVARATDELRSAEGDTLIGFKLGWTSAAMREALGIERPNWGTLWASHVAPERFDASGLTHPKIEPELVYRVPVAIEGATTAMDVARLGGQWALGLEVVDPRFADYGFRWLDNTADNSSAARVVIGDFVSRVDVVEPAAVTVEFSDGDETRVGVGANAMGDPYEAVAWLARSLRAEGTELLAGQIVFTGGLTAPFDLCDTVSYRLRSPDLPSACTIVI